MNIAKENQFLIKQSKNLNQASNNYKKNLNQASNNYKKNNTTNCWLCNSIQNVSYNINGYSCVLCNQKMKYLQWF